VATPAYSQAVILNGNVATPAYSQTVIFNGNVDTPAYSQAVKATKLSGVKASKDMVSCYGSSMKT
jgi:hypothetical protein